MEAIITSYTVADALAIVFGTPPFGREYTTHHIQTVLGKLLGQDITEAETLEALRAAAYATPRPGAGRRHPLKWRFRRAPNMPNGPQKVTRKPRPVKSLIDSQRLKL